MGDALSVGFVVQCACELFSIVVVFLSVFTAVILALVVWTEAASRSAFFLAHYLLNMSRYNAHKTCCVPQCTHRAVKGEVSLHSFSCDKRMKEYVGVESADWEASFPPPKLLLPAPSKAIWEELI